jgi:hypothetical protein
MPLALHRLVLSSRARLQFTLDQLKGATSPGLEKVFRPAVIEVLDDSLAAAELGDAVLAAQAFQYNANLVFRLEVSPRRATDLLHHFCRRFFLRHGFLSHLRSLQGYDEPDILPSSTHPICLMSADGGQ